MLTLLRERPMDRRATARRSKRRRATATYRSPLHSSKFAGGDQHRFEIRIPHESGPAFALLADVFAPREVNLNLACRSCAALSGGERGRRQDVVVGGSSAAIRRTNHDVCARYPACVK